MTTVNAKSTYSAPGNGQILLGATVSITSGLKVLTVASGPFVLGDVGKYLAVTGAGDGGAPGTPGARVLLTTITAFTDAQHVTLNDAATHTLTSSSQDVEWGNDDAPAFMAFNADFQGQTGVQLNCPTGRYCFVTAIGGVPGGGPSPAPFKGVKGLRVLASDGDGTAVFSNMLGAGSGIFFWGASSAAVQDYPGQSAKIATVRAGSLFVDLLTPAEISFFAGLAGKRCQLQGFEVQGPGSTPSNPYNYEYPIISAVDGGLSKVTFTAPIRNGYKQTWPEWITGSAASGDPNSGVSPSGAARIFVVNDLQTTAHGSWDCGFLFEGLGVDFRPDSSGTPFLQPIGRSVTWKGGYFTHVVPIMSQNEDYVIDGTDLTNTPQGECDKQVVNVTIKNLSAHGYFCQSPSPDVFTFENYHALNTANGTGKSVVATNCIFDIDVKIGSESFGSKQGPFRATNTQFNGGFTIPGAVAENDFVGKGYTMINGIIRRLKTDSDGQHPQWMMEGAWNFWVGRFHMLGPAFQAVDVFEEGGYVCARTNLAGGVPTNFPRNIADGTFGIQTHPAPQFTLDTNCVGSENALGWANVQAGAPMYSRWLRTYTGNIGTSKPVIPMIGKVVLIKITVGAGYSAGTFTLDGPFVVHMSDGSVSIWSPSIDLTTPGERLVTLVRGDTISLGSDSGLALPGSDAIWLVDDQITPKMFGATGSGSVTLEMKTDQGINKYGLNFV